MIAALREDTTYAEIEDDELEGKDLDAIERYVRLHQMAVQTHALRSLEAALKIGQGLSAARKQLKHGEFRSWCEDRFQYKDRHCRNLMALWANRQRVADLLESDPDLSLRGALAAINDKLKEGRALAPGRTPLEVAPTLPWELDIRELDAADLPTEWDGSVDLVVTSWPYGVGEKREGYVDVPSFAEWQLLASEWAEALVRVLKPHGRVALVLPVSVRKGGPRPLAAWGNVVLNGAGLKYETTIEWPKGQGGQTANSVPRGSVDSPNALTIATGAEQILVYHRGDWNLGRPGEPSDLEHEDWLAWTNGMWTISGATDPLGYPCVFPEELALRLIKLLSFPGDTVADFHLGSGTTAKVAALLGRRFKGGDINPEAVKRARARASQVLVTPAGAKQARADLVAAP